MLIQRKRPRRRPAHAPHPLAWRTADEAREAAAGRRAGGDAALDAFQFAIAGMDAARLARALRAERRRGTAGQAGYDPARHLALARALRGEGLARAPGAAGVSPHR